MWYFVHEAGYAKRGEIHKASIDLILDGHHLLRIKTGKDGESVVGFPMRLPVYNYLRQNRGFKLTSSKYPGYCQNFDPLPDLTNVQTRYYPRHWRKVKPQDPEVLFLSKNKDKTRKRHVK